MNGGGVTGEHWESPRELGWLWITGESCPSGKLKMIPFCVFLRRQHPLKPSKTQKACFLKMLFSVWDIYGYIGVLSKDF